MYFVVYIDRVNTSTAAPLMQKDLGLSNSGLGLAFSAFAYPYAFFQIVGGWLGDKFGARRTLGICGLLVGIATASTGLVGLLVAGAALMLRLRPDQLFAEVPPMPRAVGGGRT